MNTRIILEIGSNHNQSLTRIKKLIDQAKQLGVWGVKFQYFKADKLYHPDFKSTIQTVAKRELSQSFLPKIKKQCEELGLVFGCSVFNPNDIPILIDNGVDYLKIGSYETLYAKLIQKVKRTKKPWMISAGMNAISIIQDFFFIPPYPEAVFHCNSNYPAYPENCNLLKIKYDMEIYPVLESTINFGWSDHTREPGVIFAAIMLGAKYIELHFDLEDGQGGEYQYRHCWTKTMLWELKNTIKIIEQSLVPHNENEKEVSKWRMEPEDGMRPLKLYRKELLEKENGDK